jgi:putative ABC transport system permease protein
MRRGAAVTLTAVLALTAGVTAAAIDVAAGYLWRPLPYPSSERLVVVDYPRANGPSPGDLQSVDGAATAAVADLSVASDPDSFTILGGDAPFTADGRWISGDVFTMFGVVPVLGRTFTREEAARGEPVAMIGHHLWQDQFGGRPDIVGRSITVRATIRQRAPETFTVVGVLPPRFWHIEGRTSLLLPLKDGRMPWLLRLRDGVSSDEAAKRIAEVVRAQRPGVSPAWTAVVRSARDAHIERVRPMLTATVWGVVLLAVVALSNLVFLQMARGVSRQREVAVRIVLGAGRRALVRQAGAEGLAIGGVAAILGCAIAWLLLRTGTAAVEQYFGRMVPAAVSSAGIDPRLLVLIVAATMTLSLALAVVMLVVATSATLASALAGTSSATDSPVRLLIRQLIVSSQVAVAFCLLVGAALMIRTAWHLGHVDLGFEPNGVLSANLTLPESTYRSLNDRREFFEALTGRLAQLPEVAHAGVTGWLPFRVGPAVTVLPEGASAESAAIGSLQGVSPEYFNALQIRLREGRLLTADDRAGRETVAVVSTSLARAVWGDDTPLGRKFRIKFSPEPGRGFGPYTVVGIVDEVLQSVMNPTPPQLYVAFYQQPLAGNAFLQIKTRTAPMAVAPEVARIVRDMNPDLALGAVTTLDAIVDAEGLRPRLLARALTAFAGLAVLLAIVGLYAVSAWIARQRQREAALRIALGADRWSVAALLARRGLIAVSAGLALGWVATLPLAASIASEVRGVSADDAATRLIVATMLMLVSLAAILGPASRASSCDPSALLRNE